jgi:RNA polymerase sigma-70 factor (ECF subfamily)
VHAEAPDATATDWPQIVGLYDVLLRADPSPVVELNRAMALSRRDNAAGAGATLPRAASRGARRLDRERARSATAHQPSQSGCSEIEIG